MIVLPDGNPLDYQSAILLGYRVERATKTEQEMLAKWQPEHAAAIFGGAEDDDHRGNSRRTVETLGEHRVSGQDGICVICVICGHDFLWRLPRRLYLSLMQQRAPGLRKGDAAQLISPGDSEDRARSAVSAACARPVAPGGPAAGGFLFFALHTALYLRHIALHDEKHPRFASPGPLPLSAARASGTPCGRDL